MNNDVKIIRELEFLRREVERLRTGEKAPNVSDGWIPVSSTWTYASATTITVPSGAASIYKVGQGVKLNNTDTKYFYIVGVADTLLTITGGSDYTLDSDAISAISYTNTPGTAIGFPVWFTWTPSVTGATVGDGTIAATFSITGKVLYLSFSFTLGSTSAVSNYVHFTAPAPISAIIAFNSWITDNGVGGYVGTGEIIGQEIYIEMANIVSSKIMIGAFDANTPFTWVAGDSMKISGTFRLA